MIQKYWSPFTFYKESWLHIFKILLLFLISGRFFERHFNVYSRRTTNLPSLDLIHLFITL